MLFIGLTGLMDDTGEVTFSPFYTEPQLANLVLNKKNLYQKLIPATQGSLYILPLSAPLT